MSFSGMYHTQGMLFLLMLLGLLLRKIRLVTEQGEKFLTDLVLYVTLPASILKSFQMELTEELLRTCATTLLLTVLILLFSFLVGKVAFRFLPLRQRRIMEYASVVSNAGILGNPVAEGMYGSLGLMYASIYAVPVRIYMWSLGMMCFTEAPDSRTLVKKTCTHPCIIAAVLGLLILGFQVKLPETVSMTIASVAGANTSLSMILVGTILASVPLRTVLDKLALYYSVVRLFLVPLAAFLLCRISNCDTTVTGVIVTLTGMPAGSTTAVLAEKYGCDTVLAVKCVVLSTLLSMATIPLWCMFVL